MTKKISEKIFNICGLCVIFSLGCFTSMALLYIAMFEYGDKTVTIDLVKGTAAYWLIPVAVFTFIGLLASARRGGE